MQQHFSEDLSVGQVARSVCLSTRTFIRRFKAMTGCLPGAYLQALRVSAAKEMLEQGSRSIAAVSFETGYEDIAFFRTLFKRHTGMTPTAYRACHASRGLRSWRRPDPPREQPADPQLERGSWA